MTRALRQNLPFIFILVVGGIVSLALAEGDTLNLVRNLVISFTGITASFIFAVWSDKSLKLPPLGFWLNILSLFCIGFVGLEIFQTGEASKFRVFLAVIAFLMIMNHTAKVWAVEDRD